MRTFLSPAWGRLKGKVRRKGRIAGVRVRKGEEGEGGGRNEMK